MCVISTMTFTPLGPLPVVLSLEPARTEAQRGIGMEADGVITIPITVHTGVAWEQPSWDELLGQR